MDADFKMFEITCADNVEKLKFDCSVLKRRVEEENNIVVGLRRRINALQETECNIKEKLKEIDLEYETQIPIIKKQIININERIDQKEKIADSIAKNGNCQYTQLWQLQQNNFIGRINEVLKVDNIIREFLGINKTQTSCGKQGIEILPECLKPHVPNQVPVFDVRSCKNPMTNSYGNARERALNKLLLDFILKNSSFIFDYNSNEILETHLMENYADNVLRELKLNNEDSWNFMKSMFKPFVICAVCKYEVNWDFDETLSNALEQKQCSINKSDNCAKEFQTVESLHEILSTHITQHSENIDKVNKLDSPIYELNSVHSDNNSNLNTNEEENKEYSTNIVTTVQNDTPAKKVTQCVNVNHKLFIDNKHFMPILTEIIKKTRLMHKKKPKTMDERLAKGYNFLQWKLSENDLRDYWSQFINYIPSTVDSWDMFHRAIKRYHSVLIDRRNKLAKLEKIERGNKEIKNILGKLECS